jgi:thiamine-monophosphate kinase
LTTHRNEDSLVAAIGQVLERQSRALRVPIGDDAAAWKPSRSKLSLITTDALVDGVHFISGQTTPEAFGHKALAVNLSDIAAMGGEPVIAVVALGVTESIDEAWASRFYRGMHALAQRHRCAIGGGDIVRTPQLLVALTVVGEVRRSNLRLRRGAKAGDLVCVTGPLGLSAGALRLGAKAAPALRLAYQTPMPRLREGKFLGASRSVHAMMDISDGLSLDVSRMAKASRLDVYLDLDAIRAHRPRALDGVEDGLDLMLYGGDDYELLAAIEARAYAYLSRRFKALFKRELWVAGRFESGPGNVWEQEGAACRPHAPRGYDHLAFEPKPPAGMPADDSA